MSNASGTEGSGSHEIFSRPGKRLHNELEKHHAIHGKSTMNSHFQ